MKKVIFTLLFLLISATGFAQTTWNLRLGTGISTVPHRDMEVMPAFVVQTQCNIPFRKGSSWTFSPSLELSAAYQGRFQASFPLTVGYKVPMGRNKIFYPKFGAKVGYETFTTAIVGPTAALDLELSHFVMGLSAAYSLTKYSDRYREYSYNPWNLFLTFGYKF